MKAYTKTLGQCVWALSVALALAAPLAARAQAPAPQPQTAAPAAAQAPAQQPAVTPAAEPAATAAQPPAPATFADARLPRDLSPWGMFLAADIVVKLVMIGLAFASLLTWTIWLAKSVELLAARRRLSAALQAVSGARTLAEAMGRLKDKRNGAGSLVRCAEEELRMSADAIDADGIKERVALRFSRIEAATGRAMIRGTGLLATIGATAPFVGLFGTVWGIMNSFIGISKSHTTNLAVVAPGIAEALLATALGLVAAIPAVVMYNIFSRWTANYRALHGDLAAEILRLVSRDLDRGTLPRAGRRPAAAAE